MSGHSKWHSIRHKKAANDAARGKVLTKHAKIIMVLARTDPNPDNNAVLRNAISNAKSDGVPKDNIEKLLKKASGADKDAAQFSEQLYEGFGPEGIPFLIHSLTDNSNRAYTLIRTAFNKNGGNLGSSGSVKFLFDHIGVIIIKNGDLSEEGLFEKVIEAGAENFEYGAGESEILTKFESLGAVRDALEEQGVEIVKAIPEYRAKDPVPVSDQKILEKIERLIEVVEEVEDVDDLFVGFEPTADILNQA